MSTLIATFLRNRFGALLIVIQVALTLAIVTNAAAVVREQLDRRWSDHTRQCDATRRCGEPADWKGGQQLAVE